MWIPPRAFKLIGVFRSWSAENDGDLKKPSEMEGIRSLSIFDKRGFTPTAASNRSGLYSGYLDIDYILC
jgi:hypothetical protein